MTIASPLVGGGSLSKTGEGALTLSGQNTFSGDLTIEAGIVNAAAGHNAANATQGALGNPQATRSIIVDSDATLRFTAHDVLGNAASTPKVAIVVNGGELTNAGGQFNTLGPLTLNGGTLTGSGGANGSYQMYRLAGAVTVSADATISGSGANSGIHLAAPTTIDVSAGVTLTVSANLIGQTPKQSGPASLTKTGEGALTLSGLNTFAGNLTIDAGTVNAGAGDNAKNATQGALGNPQATRSIIVDSDATLRFTANDVLGNAASTPKVAIVVNGGEVTNAGEQFNTLGPLTLNGGTLTGSGGANGSYQMYRLAGVVTVSADATISGSGANSGIHLAAPTTFDVAANATLAVSANLIGQTPKQSGPASLTKTGAGALTLAGQNTFTGTSTVTGGTLLVSGSVVGNITEAGGIVEAAIDWYYVTVSAMSEGNTNGHSSGLLSPSSFVVSAHDWLTHWQTAIEANVTGTITSGHHSGAFPASPYFAVGSVASFSGLLALKNPDGTPRLAGTDKVIAWEDWTDGDFDDDYWLIGAVAGDVDADSDNSSPSGEIEHSPNEENLEDIAPGKVVAVPLPGEQAVAVPLDVKLIDFTPSKSKVEFTGNASLFKLWNADPSVPGTAMTIEFNHPYLATDEILGFTSGAWRRFYVEALSPGSEAIGVSVDPLGDGQSGAIDSALFSAVLVDIDTDSNNRDGIDPDNNPLTGEDDPFEEDDPGRLILFNDEEGGERELAEIVARDVVFQGWSAEDFTVAYEDSIIQLYSNSNGTSPIASGGILPPNATVYARGVSLGTTDVTWTYTVGAMAIADTVKVTTAKIDLDVLTVQNGQWSNVLAEDLEESAGAFIPVNDDDDDYDQNKDNADNDGVTGESDLLPIRLRTIAPLELGGKYKLGIPANLRVWKYKDRTGAVDATCEFLADGETTLYVEGFAEGVGELKINWTSTDGTRQIADADRIQFTVFKVEGPRNVPDYSKYEYQVIGLPDNNGETRWSADQGFVTNATGENRAEIFWQQGAVVGKALYEASPYYQWAFEVNVVKVTISQVPDLQNPGQLKPYFTPSTTITQTHITNDSGDVLSEEIAAGPESTMPGLEWRTTITLDGPDVGGIADRGIEMIKVGFIQNVVNFHKSATYSDGTELVPDLPNEAPWPLLDTLLPGKVWYPVEGLSTFTGMRNSETGDLALSGNIGTRDTPNARFPRWSNQQTTGAGRLASIDYYIWFELNICAQTLDGDTTDESIYTRIATANWVFDGSGTFANDANFTYSPGITSGVLNPNEWTSVVDGTQPVTTGQLAADAIDVRWILNE